MLVLLVLWLSFLKFFFSLFFSNVIEFFILCHKYITGETEIYKQISWVVVYSTHKLVLLLVYLGYSVWSVTELITGNIEGVFNRPSMNLWNMKAAIFKVPSSWNGLWVLTTMVTDQGTICFKNYWSSLLL